MKKGLLLFLLLFAATAVNAQTIVKGDMNNDNTLTIAAVTSVVAVILGKTSQETISLVGNPYKVDNTLVVGTWYASNGTSFDFNHDGTTTFPGGATYEFMPLLGRLLVFNAQKRPVKVLPLVKVESEYLLAVDYSTGAFTYYTNSTSLATGITLDHSSLSMNSGTTAQLTASITPADAFTNIVWASSDENVATVDQDGLVTGVGGGTCTITAITSGSLMMATCNVNVTQRVTSIILSQNTAGLELDAFIRLTATVLPDNAANKDVFWYSSNEDVAVVRNGRIDAYGYGTAVVTCEASDGSGVTATCEVKVYKDESGTIDGRDYVDLDLPSGRLWASCNIGANSPEDYGDYFAWGETAGYSSGKNTFDWSTYKWCKGSYNTMTKYCTRSDCGYEGFTDNKTELDFEDDAAYVNWGSSWRMPSKEDFDELINSSYTTTVWTTQNNVYGRKITSISNGNSIFLPATGWRDKSSLKKVGSDGYYWSRSLYEQYPYGSWILHINLSSVNTSRSTYRSPGVSVRPVWASE